MPRPHYRSPIFEFVNKVRGLGQAADAVARAAEDTAKTRAAGKCLVCGENPVLVGADYCGECREDAIEAGAETAKSGIDMLKELLTGR